MSLFLVCLLFPFTGRANSPDGFLSRRFIHSEAGLIRVGFSPHCWLVSKDLQNGVNCVAKFIFEIVHPSEFGGRGEDEENKKKKCREEKEKKNKISDISSNITTVSVTYVRMAFKKMNILKSVYLHKILFKTRGFNSKECEKI